jgi:hypothetical protein
MQLTPWALLDTRLKYEHLDRDSTVHEQQGNYGRDEHPLMRKYNMADRDRDRVTIEFDLSPTDRLAVNMSYYQTDDEYTESAVGLTDGKESSVNLDLNYALGKNSTAYAFFSKERIKSTISGSPNVSTGPWTSFTDDKITSWGLGISGRINDKTSYGLDYVYSDAKGNIRTETNADEPPFPELLSKLRTVRVYMNHKFNDRWGLGLNLLQEKYDSSDWYVDGFGPLDVNGLMTLGEISPNYNVWSASLFATLNF